MGNWGISSIAPEIEKLKSEVADFLNGQNSCGEISYAVYSESFDFLMSLMDKAYEQGKKDRDVETKVTENVPYFKDSLDKVVDYINQEIKSRPQDKNIGKTLCLKRVQHVIDNVPADYKTYLELLQDLKKYESGESD